MSVQNNSTAKYPDQTNEQVEWYNCTILAASRTYVADHLRDWDLYTGALNHVYNCHPNTSPSVEQFQVELSKPPGPLSLKPMPAKHPWANFKHKCKHWIQDAMVKTKDRVTKAQTRYEKHFDARLRKQKEVINVDDYLYLSMEQKYADEHRHKRAPIAEVSYEVTKVE